MTSEKFNDDWDFQQRIQQQHALPLYQERFPGCEIVEVDTEGEDEKVAKIFDYSGVDKMIRKENGATILLSQRFRRKSTGDDFSLTYSRPHTKNKVEFERLRTSLHDVYAMMPRLYGFGIVNDVMDGKAKDQYAYEQGFSEFYLVKIPKLVVAIDNGDIDYTVPKSTSNGRGNRAAYIRLSELEDHDLIDRAWKF